MLLVSDGEKLGSVKMGPRFGGHGGGNKMSAGRGML